jgi:GxxExxY protein
MDLIRKYQILINSVDNLAFSRVLHEELSGQIIGAAMAVLNELNPGLDEKLYERALVVELRRRRHMVDQQRSFSVYYAGELIGTLVPDIIVDGQVIADPKVVESFNDAHLRQMIGYLAITGLKLAVLLNFKYPTLRWKRVARGPE